MTTDENLSKDLARAEQQTEFRQPLFLWNYFSGYLWSIPSYTEQNQLSLYYYCSLRQLRRRNTYKLRNCRNMCESLRDSCDRKTLYRFGTGGRSGTVIHINVFRRDVKFREYSRWTHQHYTPMLTVQLTGITRSWIMDWATMWTYRVRTGILSFRSVRWHIEPHMTRVVEPHMTRVVEPLHMTRVVEPPLIVTWQRDDFANLT